MSFRSTLNTDSNTKHQGWTPANRNVQPNARERQDGGTYRVYTPMEGEESPAPATDFKSEPVIPWRSRHSGSIWTPFAKSPFVTRPTLSPASQPQAYMGYRGIQQSPMPSAHNLSPCPYASIQAITMGEPGIQMSAGAQGKLMSTWAAGFNVLNLFVGLGLLSKPYALQQGGLLILVGLFLMTIVANWSGKLIVRCFQHDEFRTPGDCTYLNLGKVAGGWFGRLCVIVTVCLELFGAGMILIIFLWKNTQMLIPALSDGDIVIYVTLATIPTVWVLQFTDLVFISFLGFVSTLLTTGTIVGVFAGDVIGLSNGTGGYKPESELNLQLINWEGVPVGLGIFIVSLAGHAALPSVYSKMRNQGSFEKMLNWSFIIMFVVYTMLALFGYLVYGSDTKILITSNLTENWPKNWICDVITGFVVANCYCSIAPMFAVLAEIPEDLLNIRNEWMQRVFRTLLVVVVSFAAYFTINDLAIVEAVTGGVCTMMTSIILPGAFYAILYWREMTCCNKFATMSLVAFGFGLSIMLTVGDVKNIIDTFKGRAAGAGEL